MNIPDSNNNTASASKPSRTLLIAVVAVALILGVYFWGHFQTRSQLGDQQSEHEQRISAVQGQLQEAQAQLAISNNRNQLLLARTDLYRTAADLDARNFGTANTRLQEAAAALGKVDASGAGVDPQQFAALRAAIASTNIEVAADLEQQRAKVLDLAAQLDAMALAATTEPAE